MTYMYAVDLEFLSVSSFHYQSINNFSGNILIETDLATNRDRLGQRNVSSLAVLEIDNNYGKGHHAGIDIQVHSLTAIHYILSYITSPHLVIWKSDFTCFLLEGYWGLGVRVSRSLHDILVVFPHCQDC